MGIDPLGRDEQRRRLSLHDVLVVPGLQIGYEYSFIHQIADFVKGLETSKPAGPTFREALETQNVCDAVLKSASTGRWEKVAKSKFSN